MSLRKSHNPSSLNKSSGDLSRDTEFERLFRLIQQDEDEAFPPTIAKCLTSMNSSLGLLSDAFASMPMKDQCSLLGAIDRQIHSLRVAAEEMQAHDHPLALLAEVLATQAEARVDSEAVAMLQSFRNAH